MKYVLRKNGHDLYVARQGSEQSYTTKLQKARTYPSREAAQADACGNERVLSIGGSVIKVENENEYWWLSFVDREHGVGWLGATIVKARDEIDAVFTARANNANPGGEVMIHSLPVGGEVPEGMLNHLVATHKELHDLCGHLTEVRREDLGECMGCAAEGHTHGKH